MLIILLDNKIVWGAFAYIGETFQDSFFLEQFIDQNKLQFRITIQQNFINPYKPKV